MLVACEICLCILEEKSTDQYIRIYDDLIVYEELTKVFDLLKFEFDLTCDPVICIRCARLAFRLFEFKNMCYQNENNVRKQYLTLKMQSRKMGSQFKKVYVDLKNIVPTPDEELLLTDAYIICRLCHKYTEGLGSSFLFKDSNYNLYIQKTLREVELTITLNPICCHDCCDNVKDLFEIQECYKKNRQLISSYVRHKNFVLSTKDIVTISQENGFKDGCFPKDKKFKLANVLTFNQTVKREKDDEENLTGSMKIKPETTVNLKQEGSSSELEETYVNQVKEEHKMEECEIEENPLENDITEDNKFSNIKKCKRINLNCEISITGCTKKDVEEINKTEDGNTERYEKEVRIAKEKNSNFPNQPSVLNDDETSTSHENFVCLPENESEDEFIDLNNVDADKNILGYPECEEPGNEITENLDMPGSVREVDIQEIVDADVSLDNVRNMSVKKMNKVLSKLKNNLNKFMEDQNISSTDLYALTECLGEKTEHAEEFSNICRPRFLKSPRKRPVILKPEKKKKCIGMIDVENPAAISKATCSSSGATITCTNAPIDSPSSDSDDVILIEDTAENDVKSSSTAKPEIICLASKRKNPLPTDSLEKRCTKMIKSGKRRKYTKRCNKKNSSINPCAVNTEIIIEDSLDELLNNESLQNIRPRIKPKVKPKRKSKSHHPTISVSKNLFDNHTDNTVVQPVVDGSSNVPLNFDPSGLLQMNLTSPALPTLVSNANAPLGLGSLGNLGNTTIQGGVLGSANNNYYIICPNNQQTMPQCLPVMGSNVINNFSSPTVPIPPLYMPNTGLIYNNQPCILGPVLPNNVLGMM